MASYQVEIPKWVRKEIRRLPGNMRQRIVRLLRTLEEEPRPHTSESLDLSKEGIELDSIFDLRRIRIESWRVVYVIEEEWKFVTVLAVRRRPPYQYDDLAQLIKRFLGK